MSKNTRNRILLTALAALLLVVVAVGGTMAWLTDKTGEVVNTFTTANVDIDIGEENEQLQMIPGGTVSKAPYVKAHADSEDCWVFVKITKSSNYSTYLGDYTVDTDVWTKLADDVANVDANSEVYWTKLEGDSEKNVNIYILDGTNGVGTMSVVETIGNTEMDAAETNPPSLTFTAYACQTANVTEVATAWEQASAAQPYSITTSTGTTTP